MFVTLLILQSTLPAPDFHIIDRSAWSGGFKVCNLIVRYQDISYVFTISAISIYLDRGMDFSYRHRIVCVLLLHFSVCLLFFINRVRMNYPSAPVGRFT